MEKFFDKNNDVGLKWAKWEDGTEERIVDYDADVAGCASDATAPPLSASDAAGFAGRAAADIECDAIMDTIKAGATAAEVGCADAEGAKCCSS